MQTSGGKLQLQYPRLFKVTMPLPLDWNFFSNSLYKAQPPVSE